MSLSQPARSQATARRRNLMDVIKVLLVFVVVAVLNVAWVAALVWVAAQVVKAVFA